MEYIQDIYICISEKKGSLKKKGYEEGDEEDEGEAKQGRGTVKQGHSEGSSAHGASSVGEKRRREEEEEEEEKKDKRDRKADFCEGGKAS